MIIVGLTGGIAMGKSVVAAQFVKCGAVFYNADSEVHRQLRKGGGAVERVLALFPEAKKKGGGVDRAVLSDIVFHSPAKLKKLEKILHPLIWQAEKIFLNAAKAKRKKIVVLEIPLLLETGAQKRVDVVVLASTTALIQRQRALGRPHITPGKLNAILARQMPDALKRKQADFIIETGSGKAASLRQVRAVVKELLENGKKFKKRHA